MKKKILFVIFLCLAGCQVGNLSVDPIEENSQTASDPSAVQTPPRTAPQALTLTGDPSAFPISSLTATQGFSQVDLSNPGRGWTTHSAFLGDAINGDYPNSTIAYFRFTWRQAEPGEGQFAFDALDDLIERARAAGQRLAFRIMPDRGEEGIGIPDWLLAKGVSGWYYTGADGSACFTPDAADPVYRMYARRLIDAMGARYNNHPDIEFVDIGLVGDYGEWHVTSAAPQGGVMPSLAIRKEYIDWHLAAFPDTPLLMLLGDLTQTDADALAYAIAHGTGWRADCWGDFRSSYNHMRDDYPAKLAQTPGLADAWRTKPVALETCGTVQDWYQDWPDKLDEIFQFAIANHASSLNGKSAPIPQEWIEPIASYTASIGYRFALAATPEISTSFADGETVRIGLVWVNQGNAPTYRPYQLAVRLLVDGAEITRAVSFEDIRTWMPFSADGLTYAVSFEIAAQASIQRGAVSVQAAMLDPVTDLPAIQFAMEGRNPDLWYDIGILPVR